VRSRAGRPSILDSFKPYLHQRWMQGCTSASQLFREIREHGYAGSLGTVIAYLRPFRAAAGGAPPARLPPAKVRHVTGWAAAPSRHPRRRRAGHVQRGAGLLRAPGCPSRPCHAFAELLTGLHGDRLDAWIDQVERADLPALRSFAAG
jgi:hypothetical protein